MTELESDCNIAVTELAKIVADLDFKVRQQGGLICHLEGQLKSVIFELEYYKSQRPFVLAGGHFPTEFDKIECQIFHRTDLTAKELKSGKAPWSVKLTFWQGTRKAHKDVALLDSEKFKQAARGMSNAAIQSVADAMHLKGFCGMNRARTTGKGTPYIPTEFVYGLLLDSDPYIGIGIGDKGYRIENFRPGKGDKIGHAMWYGVHVCNR